MVEEARQERQITSVIFRLLLIYFLSPRVSFLIFKDKHGGLCDLGSFQVRVYGCIHDPVKLK